MLIAKLRLSCYDRQV